jgi:hypothetical protein
MQCEECRDMVKQELLSSIFDALLKQFEVLTKKGVMDIIMDVDEFYNGAHGIRIYLMGRKYYLDVYRLGVEE